MSIERGSASATTQKSESQLTATVFEQLSGVSLSDLLEILLSERELVCAEVLVGKGRSVRSVARELGVDESTLRYRLKRREAGATDGRALQVEACAPFEDEILAWIERQDWDGESGRPESIQSLYETLVAEHGYVGSYKAVVRFVRKRAPAPKVRPVRRIETRPGTQAQVDWGTRKVFVHELGGVTPLKALVMTLSHSRLSPIRFYLDETQLSWLDGHNHALEFLGGVPLTLRIDNLKTGVKRGGGGVGGAERHLLGVRRSARFRDRPDAAQKRL